MTFAKSFPAFLVAITFSFSAFAQNSGLQEEILARAGIKNAPADVGAMSIEDLYREIMLTRKRLMLSSLALGHNSVLGESIGARGESKEAPRQGDGFRGQNYLTTNISLNGGRTVGKLVEGPEGDKILACADGTVESVIFESAQFLGDSSKKGTLLVQVCAGELITEQRTCKMDFSQMHAQLREVVSYRHDGITNQVEFYYEWNDPKENLGCSSYNWLKKQEEALTKSARQFDEAKLAAWKQQIFTACTDFSKANISPAARKPLIMGITPAFESAVLDIVKRNVKFKNRARSSEDPHTSTNSLYGESFNNGMGSAKADLERYQRQMQQMLQIQQMPHNRWQQNSMSQYSRMGQSSSGARMPLYNSICGSIAGGIPNGGGGMRPGSGMPGMRNNGSGFGSPMMGGARAF